jgi:NitT/TauT family transport system permease protein
MTTVDTRATVTNTAKSKSGLGSIAFRPNAVLPSGAYHTLLIVELCVFVGLWLLLPAIIPGPVRVFNALMDLINNEGLITELWTSLTLNLEAIALSTVLSLLVAYGAAIPAFKPIATVISKGRFLSLIGLSFVMTLYVGGGHPLKLAMLTFGMSVFFVTSMVDVVLQVPRDTLDYVRTLRAGEWQVLWEARVRGTMGTAFDIIRQNAAMGWLMLTMVEGLVRSEGGIGRLLLDQQKHFSLESIFAVQLVFVLVGIGQDMLIAWLKDVVAPWASLAYTKDK